MVVRAVRGYVEVLASGQEESSGWGSEEPDRLRARVAEALGRHLVVSFPETVPAELVDAVQVA